MAAAQLTGHSASVGCAVLSAGEADLRQAAASRVTLVALPSESSTSSGDETWQADQAHALVDVCEELTPVQWWIGHDLVSGEVCAAAARITGAKAAIVQHTNYPAYGSVKQTDGAAIIQRRDRELRMLSRADALFGVGPKLTQATQDRVRRGQGRVVTPLIPGLASVEPYPRSPTSFRAITFGRLDPVNDRLKQGRLAVHAFARTIRYGGDIVGRDPQIVVIGVGEGADEKGVSEEQALRRLASKQADRVVSVIGHPFTESRLSLFELLADSTVCLMLSVHDGFGLTGWEAIAAEVPLIVSKNTGLYEFLDSLGGAARGCVRAVDVRGALGEPPYAKEDVREVAKLLREVAFQPDRAKRDAQALKDQLRPYTWQQTAKDLLAALGIQPIVNDATADHGQARIDLPPSNLPVPADSFRGRDELCTSCAADLSRTQTKFLTVLGPPGAGKTRFARELGNRLRAAFDDHVYAVDLTAVADPGLVAATISRALQLDPAEPILEALKEYFRGQRALIILDNFDRVVSAARLVIDLMSDVPGLAVVATSRIPVGVADEVIVRLAPLDSAAAIELFHDRTSLKYTGPAFRSDVEQLCNRLEHLPLAIELIAPRADAFTPAELVELVSQSLLSLESTRQDLPANLRSLRAAFDWSYELLPATDQHTFEQLSVFEGGWNLTSGAAIVGIGLTLSEFADRLFSLQQRCLINRDNLAGPVSRFSMLDVLRHYARDRLSQRSQLGLADLTARHAAYFLELAENWSGHDGELTQPQLLAQFAIEQGNLLTALDHFVRSGDIEAALRLAQAIGWYLWSRDYAEGFRQLGRVLALPLADDASAELQLMRARVLIRYGGQAIRQCRLTTAASALAEALGIAEGLSDEALRASALSALALVEMDAAQYDSAREHFNTALKLLGPDEVRERADCLDGLAIVAADNESYLEAHRLFDKAAEMYRSIPDEQDVAWTHNGRAQLSLLEDNPDRAVDHALSALRTGRDEGDPGLMLWAANYLGLAHSALGEYATSKASHEDSLRTATLLGNIRPRILAFEGFSVLAARCGQVAESLTLRGFADQQREQFGLPRTHAETRLLADATEAEESLDALTRRQAIERGASMTVERAANLARSL